MGWGGGYHGGTSRHVSSSMHIVLASSSTCERQTRAAIPPRQFLSENTTRNSERLKTSPHVQFYIHSLDMCTHNIMSPQTPLCPVTILLEYKLIFKLLESSRLLVNKRQRRADTEQNLRCVQRGLFWAGHLAYLFMRGGTQLKGITVHKTYGTQKEIREGYLSPGFSICRVLRSDCLFPLTFFFWGGRGAGRGVGVDLWGEESYGTVQAT